MNRLPIDTFLALAYNQLLIDVRSPVEYNHAHIPGAVTIPLFTDEERKIVGTTYKQKSRGEAIKAGLDFFGPKMRKIVEEVERIADCRLQIVDLKKAQYKIANRKSEIFIYCWRGGMRSAAIAWLLNLYGFNVSILAGGYKAFRSQVLQTFTLPWNFKVLGGYTGSGKTEMLHHLKKGG
jgi:tRNA 2-selenouridine synthase